MLDFDDVEEMYPGSKITVGDDNVVRLFWVGTIRNLPAILHQTAHVIVLIPSMEVIKDREGYGVTAEDIPDEFHVKAVMDT